MNIPLAHFKGFWQPHVTDTTHTIRFSHPLLYRKQNAKNMRRTEVRSLDCCTHTLPLPGFDVLCVVECFFCVQVDKTLVAGYQTQHSIYVFCPRKVKVKY